MAGVAEQGDDRAGAGPHGRVPGGPGQGAAAAWPARRAALRQQGHRAREEGGLRAGARELRERLPHAAQGRVPVVAALLALPLPGEPGGPE